ncbi:MAG: MAPEG family protein [Rhodobiaceae bacterium]|nr:MAPEG family protein [Rhodobiaceae bacterium]MCC0012429.1 MAPEG family protein [Rhodobiaceae bacterium]MCC0019285.1 MAPEG family protein [Rhodobiaceae bacterium]
MSTDLTMLVAACFLAFIQIGLYSFFAIRQWGAVYAAGPRDAGLELTGVPARLKRAYVNMLETLPIFAIGVLVAHVTGKADDTTAMASQVYLAARIAYVPAYGFGFKWGRSVIWGVALIAILVILFEALN